MIEYRISYNPFTHDYTSDTSTSHAEALYNRGKQAIFYEYIRGIILDGALYLRVYYPYDNIDSITNSKLYQSSYKLLKDNTSDILKHIEKQDGIIITSIRYNVTNDLLSGLKLCNI